MFTNILLTREYMLRFLFVLLLAGCATGEDTNAEMTPEQIYKYLVTQKRCDYMIGGSRDSEEYLRCMEIE